MTSDTLGAALQRAIQALRQARIANSGSDPGPDPGLDARLLVQWATGTEAANAVIQPERAIRPEERRKLDAALHRRIAGEPVHRIIGERAFYGLDFTLSADTLEPRPDTETAVDLALPFLKAQAAVKPRVTCLDMGTGSGAIAIALLANVAQLHATGADIAQGALTTALGNARRAGVAARFTLCESDWLTSVTGRFDLIISNPPYIPHEAIANLDAGVRLFDPLRALDGGADGLDFYRTLAAGAGKHLHRESKLVVEIGIGQKQAVTAIFAAHGYRLEKVKNDLAGIERAMMFCHSR